MGNVVGVVGWIAIIAAIVRHSRRRKAARAQQQTPVRTPNVGRREAGPHPDLGAGLALGHAIAQMHHSDPNAGHLGNIATAAYWTSELSEPGPDNDDE